MNSYKKFTNYDCEYFSVCHGGVEKNCLFCFCPMYYSDCLGAPKYLPNGVKDCGDCIYPHIDENYDLVVDFLKKKCDTVIEKITTK